MLFKILLSGALFVLSNMSFALEQSAYSQQDLLHVRDNAELLATQYQDQVKNDIAISNKQIASYDTIGRQLAQIGLSKLPKTAQDNHPKFYQGVMIFASLGMPTQSLIALVREAHRIGLPIILRGFYKGDTRATSKRIYQIVYPKGSKESMGGFVIDPNWFTMYGIKKVPAFVVTDQLMPCNNRTAQQGCVAKDYDIIYGNISIESALRIAANRGEFKAKAQEYLARIKP